DPAEPGLPRAVLSTDPVLGGCDELVVTGLHPFTRQRPRVLDPLLADLPPARLLGGVLLVGCPTVEDAARPEALAKLGELLGIRVVGIFGLLLGVQVVEVAEELVEPMAARQVLVAVTEVVLAKLTRRVAKRLEELGDGRILVLKPQPRARHTDLGQARAEPGLPRDKGRTSRRAALLTVCIREAHPFCSDSVDVGRAISHHPAAITGKIPDPD